MKINDPSGNVCDNFGHNWIKNKDGETICQYCGRDKNLKNK